MKVNRASETNCKTQCSSRSVDHAAFVNGTLRSEKVTCNIPGIVDFTKPSRANPNVNAADSHQLRIYVERCS